MKKKGIKWKNLPVTPVEVEDCADLETNDYALCVHCGASHHMDEAHTCDIKLEFGPPGVGKINSSMTAMESAQKYIDEQIESGPEKDSPLYDDFIGRLSASPAGQLIQAQTLKQVAQKYIDEHESVDIEAMKTKLLRYSFEDVLHMLVFKDPEDTFSYLTKTEKDIIGSQENFDRLLSTLRDGDE
jgi:hypothetical protein